MRRSLVALLAVTAALGGTALASGADDEALVSYRTAGKVKFGKQATPAGRCDPACLVWRFACSADCSVKATSRIVLPGADWVERDPGSFVAGEVQAVVVRPNRSARRRINAGFGDVRLKTKLKALGNSSSDSDLDLRVFRLKR